MMKQTGLLGLLAIVSVGCGTEKVESEDIRTSGIYATFEVTATGNAKTSVRAELKTGGKNSNTYLVLTGEDKLVCTAGETEKTLAKSGNDYTATFSGDAGNTAFNFAFLRGDEDEAATDSNVTLPDPFTIAGTPTEPLSRTASLTVTWEPSSTPVPTTFELDGNCLRGADGTVPDDGTLTLQGSDFDATLLADDAATDPNDDDENCQATLCIERRRNGTLDPAFANEEGGEIYAIQRRCVEFTSTP